MAFVELPGCYSDAAPIDNDFEPIPADNYYARIDKCEVKVGKESGKPYLNIAFKIEESTEYDGRILWHNMISIPCAEDSADDMVKKSGRLKHFLNNWGIDASQGLNTEELLGCRAELKVGVKAEKYNGEDRTVNVIKSIAAA